MRSLSLVLVSVAVLSAPSFGAPDGGTPRTTITLDGATTAALVAAEQDFLRRSAETGGLLGSFDGYTIELEKESSLVRVVFVPPEGSRGGVAIYTFSTRLQQITDRQFLK